MANVTGPKRDERHRVFCPWDIQTNSTIVSSDENRETYLTWFLASFLANGVPAPPALFPACLELDGVAGAGGGAISAAAAEAAFPFLAVERSAFAGV